MRTTRIKRTSPSRRKMDALLRQYGAEAAEEWHRRVTANGCQVCPRRGEECEGMVQGHHIIRQQVIRRAVETHAFNAALSMRAEARLFVMLLWDPAVGLGVCERAHRRHHSGKQPIERAFLPSATEQFAAAYGFLHVLEREYC